MSDTHPAIFLSYASQDADIARRICDALRAEGLEVWFDQSELRGGDAWDQSIRKQIKECALFVPIISVNTNSREEGYFRLEWKLAVDRSHLMADSKPFLFPVLLEGLAESKALVPDKFRERQWTKLQGDESISTFAKRIAASLRRDFAPGPDTSTSTEAATPMHGTLNRKPAGRSKGLWAAAGVALIAIVGLVTWQPWASKPASGKSSATTGVAGATPETRALVAQVEDLIKDPMTATRENYVLADELMQRVLKTDGNIADHWVLAARVSLRLWEQVYDRSAERKLRITEQVDRALKLSQGSIAARTTQMRAQAFFGGDEESVRMAKEILREDPNNREALQRMLLAHRANGEDAEANIYRARLRKLPGGDPISMLFDTLRLANRGKMFEAEKSFEELFALSPTRIVYNLRIELLKDYFLDPKGAVEFVARIPEQFRTEDAIAGHIANAYISAGRGEDAVALLKRVPRDYLSEFAFNIPKGLLAGLAHEVAAQPAAAALEWRAALALVEKRLAADSADLMLLANKAQLQAVLGQKSAALETLRLRNELGGKENPIAQMHQIRVLVRSGKAQEAVDYLVREWAGARISRRCFLVRDLAFLPEYASFRKEKRVAAMIAEHQAFVQKARAAPSQSP